MAHPADGGVANNFGPVSLFIGDLGPEVSDAMLLEAFQSRFPSAFGAKVIRDSNTGMCRGYGFVRFGKAEEAEQALTSMPGVYVGTRSIRVSRANKSDNSKGTGGVGPLDLSNADQTNTTVFVGNIDHTIDREILRKTFEPYGTVINVKIPQGRGCGFVCMQTHAEAENAMRALHGSTIESLTIRVSWGRPKQHHHPTPLASHAAMQQQQQQQAYYMQQQRQQQMMYYRQQLQQQQQYAAMAARAAATRAQQLQQEKEEAVARQGMGMVFMLDKANAGYLDNRQQSIDATKVGPRGHLYSGARAATFHSHGLKFDVDAHNAGILAHAVMSL